MKIAVIGDPHWDNRKMFGRPTDIGGVNTRMYYVSQAMRWIADQLPEDVHHVAILGDITHQHGRLTPPVLREVSLTLDYFMERGFDVGLLSGNHDQDATGNSIIPAFGDENDGRCVETFPGTQQWYYGYRFPVYGISYGDREQTLTGLRKIAEECETGKKGAVVFMHHHFDGAKHGNHEFQPPGGLTASDIPDCVKAIFCGHYHMRHRVDPRVMYVGAPMQHDFGEASYRPNYMILHYDEEEDFVSYTSYEVPPKVAPRFHILAHSCDRAAVPGNPDMDYYRIDLPSDVDPLEIKDLQGMFKNVIVKPLPLSTKVRSRVEQFMKDEAKEGKVEIPDVIDVYATMHTEDKTRAEFLADLGRDIAGDVLDAQED